MRDRLGKVRPMQDDSERPDACTTVEPFVTIIPETEGKTISPKHRIDLGVLFVAMPDE